jgi:hypothetical protein
MLVSTLRSGMSRRAASAASQRTAAISQHIMAASTSAPASEPSQVCVSSQLTSYLARRLI